MSYRTSVNGIQVFGNNESYAEWLEFIKSQGVNVDEEGCYEGEITDFMGALVVIEKIVLQLNKQREELKERWNGEVGVNKIRSLFDFTDIPKKFKSTEDPVDELENSLFDSLMDTVENSYAFIPYMFFKACEDDLMREHVFTTKGHWHCYKLKEGKTIHVEAH